MTVKTLHLAWNMIGNVGVRHLADALKCNTTLTTLNLASNNIFDDGIKDLADALTINTSVHYNYVSNTNTNVGKTGCQDKFNNNGTSISRVGSRDSDAICTKMIGKLSNGHKFTVRNVSSTGCPQDLESSVVVGNDTTVRISDLEIYCCNKKLCNQAINRYHIQSNILILSVFIINSMYFVHGFSNK
ncbi:unnamed protein product [Rotaria sordida]|uniref:Uncharacterized protein n=1 Tax=Rotaria sordida TaxID=392033 RepID=A0A819CAG7_9BILA|nr:unnamed protein product [Rotaria sordida]